MPLLHANGINIYYEWHNKGHHRPLVLIAGFSCDHTFWAGVLEPLSQQHDVLLIDNRGIGQTDTPNQDYSLEMMANDVLAVIDALKIEKPVIVGQSMGSAIAQIIAKKHPEKIAKIVLINTFDYIETAPALAFELTGKLLKMNIPLHIRVQSIAPWIFSSDFLAQPKQLENLINLAINNPYPQSIIGYHRQLDAINKFNSQTWLPEIKLPTLILAAEEDLISPLKIAERVSKNISDAARLMILPGGHASPIEQPQKVSQAILAFTS